METMEPRSNLQKLLQAGVFVATSEVGPPKSGDMSVVKKKSGLLKNVTDGANITDNQTAIVRMSSIAAAVQCVQDGFEPIIQVTCRDRNRIAIQSDLLGAYALGVRNVLCLTGDHMRWGNHPQARKVYDLDSIESHCDGARNGCRQIPKRRRDQAASQVFCRRRGKSICPAV